ncbi:MAG: hydantoinase B/oxoprolinase family protein [Alphaproteobacteria bacterium]|nr:hydantoinase B/oxoprolinase family protein [Alphaproteobacteria bacterium]
MPSARTATARSGASLAQTAELRPFTKVNIDPITLQVLGGAFHSIATQMAELLIRMAYSNIMRESQDIGAGILDVVGRQICESDSTPMHCGSLPAYVRGVNRKLAGTYQPGDVVLHNHPYHGASHSPDYGILIPIFHDGRHVGFAGCTGHILDIGAAHPGFSVDVPDIYAEGNIIDAAKIYEAGKRNDALWAHIMDNVRTPDANSGDLEALIACSRFGEEKFGALLRRYGIDAVMSAAEMWMDYAETRLRQEIARVPSGTYRAPYGWLEDDGKNWGKPLKIATKVIVEGSDITIDLTGSNDEVETGFNVPFEGSVLPTANFAVRTLFLDEATTADPVPQNDGIFRPIHVIAPEGSIYNPRFPRGCEARFVQINRIPDQVLQAFAKAMPERVVAGNSANVSAIVYSGFNEADRKYWVVIEVNEGSYGGRFGKDGIDAIDNLMANTRNTPIEESELRVPIRCERYELRDDPPAAGRWRGGIGSVKRWRFLTDAAVNSTGDHRSVDPPRGLFGGANGMPGRLTRNAGTKRAQKLAAKVSDIRFKRGETIEIVTVSAAGYGDPVERDPEAVAEDVREGLLDARQARRDYKVVLKGADVKVDAAATTRLRATNLRNKKRSTN